MKLSLRMLGAAGLSFIMYNSSFIIRASGQTRSAVMVTNGTGKLAGPTNFFSANSNLLNQAISSSLGGGGGGGSGIALNNGQGTNTIFSGLTSTNTTNVNTTSYVGTGNTVIGRTINIPGVDGYTWITENLFWNGGGWQMDNTNLGYSMMALGTPNTSQGGVTFYCGVPLYGGQPSPGSQGGYMALNSGSDYLLYHWETNIGAPRGIVSDQYLSTNHAGAFFARNARGSISAPSALMGGDPLGAYCFTGYDPTGFGDHQAIIQAWAISNFTAGNKPAVLTFQVTPTNAVEPFPKVMAIFGNTNVSIGFDTNQQPQALAVNGSGIFYGTLAGNATGLTNASGVAVAYRSDTNVITGQLLNWQNTTLASVTNASYSTNANLQAGSTMLSNLVSFASQALNALAFTNYQGSNVVFQATQSAGLSVAAATNATIDGSFDDIFYAQTANLNFSNIINVNCLTNQTRRGIVHIKPNGNYTIAWRSPFVTLAGTFTTNLVAVGASNGFYTMAWDIMFTNYNTNTCTYALSPPNN